MKLVDLKKYFKVQLDAAEPASEVKIANLASVAILPEDAEKIKSKLGKKQLIYLTIVRGNTASATVWEDELKSLLVILQDFDYTFTDEATDVPVFTKK